MRRLIVAVVAASLFLVPAPAFADTTDNHFIVNLDGSSAPKGIGFSVFDTGPRTADVRSLPRGVKALVWLGQKCPTRAGATFKRTVDRLSDLRRVFGYYLSDEPHISDCPEGPEALATRARYIRRASEGRQHAFIVLSDEADYRAFRPAVTGVGMVGLNPYPCSDANPRCKLAKINRAVNAARQRGIPLRTIVPVYQAFGQGNTDSSYYRLPRPRRMRAMLHRWSDLVPSPRMDYAYGWGNQGSADPTLVDSPRLQRVFTRYFAR